MISEFIKNLQKNNIPYDDEKLTQLNIYYNFFYYIWRYYEKNNKDIINIEFRK